MNKKPEEDTPQTEPSNQSNKRRRLEKCDDARAIPTFDAIFKHIMSHNSICKSFLQPFIPHHKIHSVSSSETHLNFISFNQTVRNTINSETFKSVVDRILTLANVGGTFSINFCPSGQTGELKTISYGNDFLVQFAKTYESLANSLPFAERDSQVDVLCRVDGGQYVLVELQVLPQDGWHERALYNACQTYINQLNDESSWEQIKKVICINLVGGGTDNISVKTNQDITKVCFKDQNNIALNDGIEIIQYPLFSSTIRKEESYKQHGLTDLYLKWLDFFERTQEPNDDIPPEIKEAYDLIQISNLPKAVKEAYETELANTFTASQRSLVEEGREEGSLSNVCYSKMPK